ncbi:GNAT family N-acetyltransferase [Streptomyces sp. NPDC048172]|uniref:GNAT family N-acetyltransferase n=1 Tax=Streptomyces sp. NPDC048172 TaxID=3365505 RepID=UPI0037234D9E
MSRTPALTLSPLRFTGEEIAGVVALYASNPAYGRASGEYDPEDVRADRIEAELREDAAAEECEILLARDTEDRVVGIVSLLHKHPRNGHPWIGLLMVHGAHGRQGNGRALAALVEDRYRAAGRSGIGLAVLENNPSALAFWTALGWKEVDRRPDVQYGRPCVVLHKALV